MLEKSLGRHTSQIIKFWSQKISFFNNFEVYSTGGPYRMAFMPIEFVFYWLNGVYYIPYINHVEFNGGISFE